MKKLYGWTGKILEVNLSERKISKIETEVYNERFIGGIGIGQKIYWDKSSSEIDAFHPNSPLILVTGPLGATLAPSAPRLVVCGKSPSLFPEVFNSASLGGFFAAELKKSGYDGILIQGKASHPLYLNINNEKAELKDASHLWGLPNSKTQHMIKEEMGEKIRLLTIGPGAEKGSRIGTIATDADGYGSRGFGSMMGSKNLKAISVKGSKEIPVAYPEKIQQIRKKISAMTGEGYFNVWGTPTVIPETELVKRVHCHGCPQGCRRSLYRTPSGEEGVRKCTSTLWYSLWDKKLHQNITKASFLATSLANEYSLCVIELLFILLWLEKCFVNGILSEKETELPLSQMGSLEFIETFVKKISYGEGFCNILAKGVTRAADQIGKDAKELADANQVMPYGPKVFIIPALLYAIEPRPPITELHEICGLLTKWALWYTGRGTDTYVSTIVLNQIANKFWGSQLAVDFTTYVGKALAAAKIQDRQYAKESLVLCDCAYPIFDDASSEDHVGDASLESQLLSAVTGKEINETELDQIGERIFTLNRAIHLRDGRKGKEDDCLPESQFIERVDPPYDVFAMQNPELFLPGSGDEIISRKGKALEKDKFEQMRDEYYELRGWDVPTGLLKKETLKKNTLPDIIETLKEKVI